MACRSSIVRILCTFISLNILNLEILQEAEKELDKQLLPDPLVSAGSPDRNSSCEQSDGHALPPTFGADVEAGAKRAVNVVDISQSDATPIPAESPENPAGEPSVAGTVAAPAVMSQEISSPSLPPEKKKGGDGLLQSSAAEWTKEANAVSGAEDSPCRDVRESPGLPRDEEDISEESMEWESIDLALSESNDTDVEPQDADLDQEDGELLEEAGVTEEREKDTPSPNGSPLTSAASLPELTGTQEVSALSASTSASLSPVDFVEGSCLLREDQEDSLVGSLQASSLPRNEETKSVDVEDTAKHSVWPNQMAVDEILVTSEEDKAIGLMDATPKQPELFPVQKDAAAQGELVKSQDSPASVENLLRPDPGDLADTSCASREDQENSLIDSVKRRSSPAPCTDAAAGSIDLPGDQEAFAEPTEHRVSPNQMGLIEDISQDGTEWTETETLQNCEPCQAQSNLSTQSEAAGNRVSAQSFAPAEEMRFVPGSPVLQEEGGIHLAGTAHLPGHPIRQTPEEITELPRSQEEPVVAADDVALPEQLDFAPGSGVPQEEEASQPPDSAPLQVNDPLQGQPSPVIQEEQDSRQIDITNGCGGSSDVEETRDLEENNGEFKSDFENTKGCVEDENIGASRVTQEIAPGGEISQPAGTESEGPRSPSCALIDMVSATTGQSEETCAKESSGLTWISSVNLESVTPPESDEEGPARAQLPPANTKWVVSEYLQQCSVLADHKRATPEDQEPSPSAPHENVTCHQREVFERETPPENEATSTTMEIIPSSLCTFWAEVGTRSPERTLPSARTALSSQEDKSFDESTASELCEVDLEQTRHEASMPEEEEEEEEEEGEEEEEEEDMGEVGLEILPTEGHSEDSSEELGSLPPGEPRESQEDLEDACSSERELLPNRVARLALTWEGESSFADGGHEVAGDAHHSKSGGLFCTPPTAVPGDVEATDYVDDVSLHKEISESGGWLHLEDKQRMLDAEAETTKRGGPFSSDADDDRPGTPSLEKSCKLGLLQDYINFSVTKKHKEETRTFHSSKQHGCCAKELGPMHSWNNKTWAIWSDPVQNTLDVECLRFHYKVKQILKKAQRSTSVAPFTKGFSPEVRTGTLPLKEVPEGPAFSPPPRCRSPLLVTVRNPGPRPSASYRYPRSIRHRDYSEALPPPLFASRKESRSKAARCSKNQGRGPAAPFHLNKLTYDNKLQDFRGDISVIMDEFAELSRVITLGDRPLGRKGRDPPTTSEDASEATCPFLPRRTAAYEHLFTELCNTLHFRLRTVVQEACKKPYAFYLMETDDDPFFGRLKVKRVYKALGREWTFGSPPSVVGWACAPLAVPTTGVDASCSPTASGAACCRNRLQFG